MNLHLTDFEPLIFMDRLTFKACMGVLQLRLSNDIMVAEALEAALAGARSIIINPYGLKSTNDSLYAQCDIVYPSLSKALEAIDNFLKGNPELARLGDWSPILKHFDPFRDRQAGFRVLEILEEAIQR